MPNWTLNTPQTFKLWLPAQISSLRNTGTRAHTPVSVATGCEVYLVQGQHVEVTDVVLLSVSDPRPALLLIDHLSHILAHKLTLRGKSIFHLAALVASCSPLSPNAACLPSWCRGHSEDPTPEKASWRSPPGCTDVWWMPGWGNAHLLDKPAGWED